jgi:hypothetical protein
MTPTEIYQQIRRAMHGEALPDKAIAVIEQAITAAVEEDRKTRPHTFVGRTDRGCQLCGEPDRDEIHIASREMMRNRLKLVVEVEREACAKIAEAYTDGEWYMVRLAEGIAEDIRARSNASRSAEPVEK